MSYHSRTHARGGRVGTAFDHVASSIDTNRKAASTMCARDLITRRAETFSRVTGAELAALLGSDASPRSDSYSTTGMHFVAADGGPRIVVVDSSESGGRDSLASSSLCILDARDPADFNMFHLSSAISAPLMCFRQDRFPREFADVQAALVACRHRADRRIIVVDWDEKAAVEVATRLAASGWYALDPADAAATSTGNNISILTGGLKLVAIQSLYEIIQAADSSKEVAGSRIAVSSRTTKLRACPLAHLLPFIEGSKVLDTLAATAADALPAHLIPVARAALALEPNIQHVHRLNVAFRSAEAPSPPRSVMTSASKSIGGSPMKTAGSVSGSPSGTFGGSSRFASRPT